MKFIADAMLGRLAKWLRILGYDTLYSAKLDDLALARLARIEKRILLTRDEQLSRLRGIRSVLIRSDRIEEQLLQLWQEVNINLNQEAFSRCLVCNAPLDAVAKEGVKDAVPPYVYSTQEQFSRCPECGRLYWRGTHYEHIQRRLTALLSR
ncbi:MAG: Mut7-C RNAse domain-containing protein [Chloroflexi bacterium]|nr:Mut7-C RNAse domain-containing protein [Chloroflexota bacterium]